MPLVFTKAEVLSLKTHPEFNEKWVQARIAEDPALLGLGDVEIVAVEKVHSKAGRLDLLLHDDELDRRYEVELMLGPTDPSHIIRCIEYYDIERRRYPAYDHVAVLVAEDITSRFLNVMALLAGSIPLIAIQLKALRIDDKVVLDFTRVLDQTELRTDDVFELGERGGRGNDRKEADREWWQRNKAPEVLVLCDAVVAMLKQSTVRQHRVQFFKTLINFVDTESGEVRAWILPQEKVLYLGGYVGDPEGWVQRFEEEGLPASVRRGNQTARVAVTKQVIDAQRHLFEEFLRAAFDEGSDDKVAP